MKGRETKAAPSADLLVCFPSRAHLKLMPPKSICSPARPSENNMRHYNLNHHNHQHHRLLKKSSTRKGGGAGGRASPLLWAKNKQMGSDITDTEPSSPKVTCAGQIKVRSKTSSCKSWQSVMEEIERIHNSKHHKKRSSWMETLGFKKEVAQFLTCLRSIRFDLRCFGFPQSDIITTDDEDEDEGEDEDEKYQETNTYEEGNETSNTMFSKWFMVMQENQNNGFHKEGNEEQERSIDDQAALPPANALLLMRCRSAPAKSWLEANRVEEKEEHIENDDDDDEEEEECKREDEGRKRNNLRSLMEEESRKMKENLVVMKYDTDFYKLSCDIAQETWIVGGMKDPLSRSRSWKR